MVIDIVTIPGCKEAEYRIVAAAFESASASVVGIEYYSHLEPVADAVVAVAVDFDHRIVYLYERHQVDSIDYNIE